MGKEIPDILKFEKLRSKNIIKTKMATINEILDQISVNSAEKKDVNELVQTAVNLMTKKIIAKSNKKTLNSSEQKNLTRMFDNLSILLKNSNNKPLTDLIFSDAKFTTGLEKFSRSDFSPIKISSNNFINLIKDISPLASFKSGINMMIEKLSAISPDSSPLNDEQSSLLKTVFDKLSDQLQELRTKNSEDSYTVNIDSEILDKNTKEKKSLGDFIEVEVLKSINLNLGDSAEKFMMLLSENKLVLDMLKGSTATTENKASINLVDKELAAKDPLNMNEDNKEPNNLFASINDQFASLEISAPSDKKEMTNISSDQNIEMISDEDFDKFNEDLKREISDIDAKKVDESLEEEIISAEDFAKFVDDLEKEVLDHKSFEEELDKLDMGISELDSETSKLNTADKLLSESLNDIDKELSHDDIDKLLNLELSKLSELDAEEKLSSEFLTENNHQNDLDPLLIKKADKIFEHEPNTVNEIRVEIPKIDAVIKALMHQPESADQKDLIDKLKNKKTEFSNNIRAERINAYQEYEKENSVVYDAKIITVEDKKPSGNHFGESVKLEVYDNTVNAFTPIKQQDKQDRNDIIKPAIITYQDRMEYQFAPENKNRNAVEMNKVDEMGIEKMVKDFIEHHKPTPTSSKDITISGSKNTEAFVTKAYEAANRLFAEKANQPQANANIVPKEQVNAAPNIHK